MGSRLSATFQSWWRLSEKYWRREKNEQDLPAVETGNLVERPKQHLISVGLLVVLVNNISC